MSTRLALLSSFVVLSGCALVHERPSAAASIPDAAYDAVAAHAPLPSDAAGCGEASFHDFAPAGMTDVRYPALAALDGGFVTTFVHFAPLHDSPIGNDYPTAAARMRGDLSSLLDVPSDAGIVSEQGAFMNRTALATGEGLFASCAVAHDEGDDLHRVPGGVAIFDAHGALVHLTRLSDDCADVALVAGHWIALETTLETDSRRHLVVLDDSTFEVGARIDLGVGGEPGVAYERVVALGGDAVVLVARPAGAALVRVDLDTGVVTSDREIPLDVALRVTAPEVDLVAREDRLSLVYRASNGTIAWASFDASLELALGPVVVDAGTSEFPVIDATPMDDGIVIAWSRDAFGAPVPLALGVALLDDTTGAMTQITTELPREYALGARTLDVAVSGDVVAVALHVDDAARPSSSLGIWSARCRVR